MKPRRSAMGYLRLTIVPLLMLIVGAAVYGQDPVKPKQEPEAPRISLRDAKEAFDKKTAVFIDARAIEAYVIEHVPQALSMPLSGKLDFKDVPKDKKIIIYCS